MAATKPKMISLAVFASGSGTNAEAIARHFQNHPVIRVALFVTNDPQAGVIARAERLCIPWVYLPKSDLTDEELVLGMLNAYAIDWIALAGWLLLVPPFLCRAFEGRMVNIHPALLPKFGGRGMYGRHVHKAVKAAGETESGITVHHVNDRFDEGEIIAQFRCPVTDHDTAADIEAKVRALEVEHYAPTLEKAMLGHRV